MVPYVKAHSDEPVENHNGEPDVGCSPPRDRKRRITEGCELTPVKCENAHGHAVLDTKQLIDRGIVGSYPADPGEARESSEEIGRQKIYKIDQKRQIEIISQGKKYSL
jgi:hypothetical protein